LAIDPMNLADDPGISHPPPAPPAPGLAEPCAGHAGERRRWSERPLAFVRAGLFAHAALVPITIAGAQIAMGVVLLSHLVSLASWRTRRVVPDPLALPIAAFVALKAASAAVSADPASAFRAMTGDWILLFYLLLRQTVRSRELGRSLLSVFLASSTLCGAMAVVQYVDGWDYIRSRPLQRMGTGYIATGFFGHHLTFGGVVLIAFAAAFAQAVFARGRGRAMAAVAAGIMGAGLLASLSRTAWVGAGGALVMVAAMAGRRAIAAVAVAGGAAGGAMLLSPTFLARLRSIAGVLDQPRARLWETALRIAADHPLLGAGPGSWSRLFPAYRVPGHYENVGHAHNDVLNQLAQVGVLGATAWIAIWVRYFVVSVRGRRRAAPDAGDLALSAAGIAAVGAFLVGGLGQCFFTDEEVAMALWLVVACTLAASAPPEVGRFAPAATGAGIAGRAGEGREP
jgi:O-antigen ligase